MTNVTETPKSDTLATWVPLSTGNYWGAAGEICTNPKEARTLETWGDGNVLLGNPFRQFELTQENSWHCLGGPRGWATAEESPYGGGHEITEVWKSESPTHSYLLIQHFNNMYELANHIVLRFPLPQKG